MAPYAKHTHIKDGFGSLAEYRGAALGEGEVDLHYALHCLKQAGYNGVYCAEYEGAEAAGGVGYAKCFRWLKEHLG
jgi:sugar phosphate isomerase/epimerase